MNKKVSVIIAVLNMVDTVERAINSVLDQTYKDVELIVMDGGSTDGTVEVIKKYSDRLAYWTSAPDNGPSDAISKALKHANGKYIGFLGADDWYEPYALEVVSNLIAKEAADICYGNMLVHKGNCIEKKDLSNFEPEKLFFYGTQWLGAVCSFVKKELLIENYTKRNDVILTDYLFFLRLYVSGKTFVHLGDKRPITNFTIGGRTTSLNYKVKKDTMKIRTIILNESPQMFGNKEKWLDILKMYFAIEVERYYRLILAKKDYTNTIGKDVGVNKPIILFGAGNMGRECASMLRFMGRAIECFVDNDRTLVGKKVDGIIVNRVDYLCNISKYLIIITSFLYQTEIENELKALRIDSRNEIRMYSLLARKVYENFGEEKLDEGYENGLFV